MTQRAVADYCWFGCLAWCDWPCDVRRRGGGPLISPLLSSVGTDSRQHTGRAVSFTMGQHHSLLCRNHIYDEITDSSKARLGPRNESVVTLDIKINDLDATDKNRKVEKENMEWDDPPTGSQESWLEDSGWEQQRSRRREDILYNIFMYESSQSQEPHINNNINFRRKSSEPKYGRLASLDVTTLEQQKYKENQNF